MIKILCVVSSVCVCHVSQTHEALTGAWAPTRRGAGVGAFTSQERSFVWNKHYERSRTTFQWSKDGIQNGWRQLSRLDLFISSDNGWLLLCWTDLNTAIEESWCLCAWVDYVLSSIVSLQCIHGILLIQWAWKATANPCQHPIAMCRTWVKSRCWDLTILPANLCANRHRGLVKMKASLTWKWKLQVCDLLPQTVCLTFKSTWS